MIAVAAAAVVVELIRSLDFELRSLHHLNNNVFIFSYLRLFLLNSILKFYLSFNLSDFLPEYREQLLNSISFGVEK